MSQESNPQIPFVPMNALTLAANGAVVSYGAGNGAIFLQIIDQHLAPVQNVTDQPVNANYEIGRFVLTPRALRVLLDTAISTAKAFEDATGKPLRTLAQFDADASMPGIQNLLSNPPKDKNP